MSAPPPATEELWSHPELAVLYVLASAVDAAEHTLVAAHPELEEDLGTDAPERFSGVVRFADELVTRLAEIGSAIELYVAQVRRERERQAQLPF